MSAGTWTTGDYRARITAVAITDGRCFHCDCSLLNFEDDAPPSSPARQLNVDHAIPRVAGGPNRADNYLASCESCNKSRQETPLSAADSRRATELWAELDLESVAVSARQRDDFKGQAVFLCRSCEVHSWHIDGSPGHRACGESLLRGIDPALRRVFPDGGRAWAGVFGRDAAEMLTRTIGSALWASPDERMAVLIQLPRVLCRKLDRVDEVMRNARDYRDLRDDPHERYNEQFSGLLPLASSAAERRVNARVSAEARAAARAYTESVGVTWHAVFRLFSSRRWPTHLLYDHRNRIRALTAQGRRRMLSELRSCESVAELFAYFEPPTSD
ncbi:HNH endonuclease signature motif containing protein [Microbacterium hominis]|uniref:HNH endonuclease n=1 Tax=Microbacterium hominis TaxID=162426 RepID=UPI0012DFF414